MTMQLNWYSADPLMGPADRLPLVVHHTLSRDGLPGRRARLLGTHFARTPVRIESPSPQCGRHAKSYTIDRKTENTKVR
jgi:hypothetical protein